MFEPLIKGHLKTRAARPCFCTCTWKPTCDREKGREIMSWRLLSRSIYGAEPCLLSASCARELRSVTCTGRLRVLSRSVTSTCTPGHASLYRHGCPTQGSVTISTDHRLFPPLRGPPGHIARTQIHVYVSPSHKLSYGTRLMSSSTPPPCRQFSAISVCQKGGWFCQHTSSLCQQRRTYAKKGWGNGEWYHIRDRVVLNYL